MYKEEYHNADAFPMCATDMAGGVFERYGMTLLDHFAGLAMQGLLSSNNHEQYAQGASFNYPVLPKLSYEIAAAMMEERKKYLVKQ